MFKKARYVLTVYKEGSFTKAAQALFISQPCLSAAIKQIEGMLGARIFERSTSYVRPTQIGLEYIRTAQQIVALENAFETKVQEFNSLLMGRVRIGGSNYVCSYIIPYIINFFLQSYPNIDIELIEKPSSSLLDMLAKGEIDILIDSFDCAPEFCAYTPLLSEKILLAVPQSFQSNQAVEHFGMHAAELYQEVQRAENLTEISIEHFKNENFVLLKPENSMYRHAMQVFRESDITPHVGLFLDQLSTSYFLCTQGNGCTFVTDTIFKYHRFDDPVLLYNVKGSGMRTLGIVYKQDEYVSPIVRKIIKTAKDHITANIT